MTNERMQNILNKVIAPYRGRALTPAVAREVNETFSKVVKGLHKTEHFLNVAIDHEAKMMIVRDNETLEYLGFLPYLDNRLMNNDTLYMVYLLHEHNIVTLQGAVVFYDLFEESQSTFGYGASVYSSTSLGIYYPDTDEFRRFN